MYGWLDQSSASPRICRTQAPTMSLPRYLFRLFVTYFMSLVYSCLVLVQFGVQYVKNFFQSPWKQKLRLEPPSQLTDPKYGVHKYLKVNNTKLHFVESGDPSKPLMLFIHGFPEFWYSWRNQILEFQKDYWCIAVDLRGYGDSEKPEGVENYHIDVLIEDLRDLVRQLGAEKCIVVAHDWGGLLGYRLRDVHGDVVSASIIMGSTSREAFFKEIWSNYEQFRKSWYVFFFKMPVLPEMMTTLNDMIMFNTSMLVSGKQGMTSADVECYKYWFGKPYAFTAPINYYRSISLTKTPVKAVSKEDVPMIAIHGEKDRYICSNLCFALKEEYPQIETIVLRKTGHFLQQEEPEEVNKIMREFLKKHNL